MNSFILVQYRSNRILNIIRFTFPKELSRHRQNDRQTPFPGLRPYI